MSNAKLVIHIKENIFIFVFIVRISVLDANKLYIFL